MPVWFPGASFQKRVPSVRKAQQDMRNLPFDEVVERRVSSDIPNYLAYRFVNYLSLGLWRGYAVACWSNDWLLREQPSRQCGQWLKSEKPYWSYIWRCVALITMSEQREILCLNTSWRRNCKSRYASSNLYVSYFFSQKLFSLRSCLWWFAIGTSLIGRTMILITL